jgi:hypothetical protein
MCERGIKLPFKRVKGSHGDTYQMKSYRSSSKDCGTCPLRSKCIGKSDFKKIEDRVDKPLYDKMHARLQTSKAKRMKKLRQSTVEPVLGTLVNFLGIKPVNTRGIRLANKCMLVAAACYNLKKLLNFKAPKVAAGVMKILRMAEKEIKITLFLLFAIVIVPDGWYSKKPLLQQQ